MDDSSFVQLDRDAILNALQTDRFGRSLEVLEKCTSTNDVAARFASEGAPEGFTVLAEEQTAGRGRRGRAWLSPRGGIWMTVIFRPYQVSEDLSALQTIGGLAVARAVRSNLDIQAQVRWPNDVVVEDRKLAGALVEAKFKGDSVNFALLGLGVNANFHADRLSDGLRKVSTSLLDLYGSHIDRTALVSSILREIEQVYDLLRSDGITELLASLRQVECSLGRRVVVTLEDTVFLGVFDDYLSPTKIRVRRDDGSDATIEASSVVSVEYVRA